MLEIEKTEVVLLGKKTNRRASRQKSMKERAAPRKLNGSISSPSVKITMLK